MTSNLTVAKPKKSITFYSLLEKYDGDIKKATAGELRRVRPNGLSNLFKAWRVYDKLKNENAPVESALA